jgi:EAL domain-containing protein (putative c-di-GMP-specific phosphodiesterase class I)
MKVTIMIPVSGKGYITLNNTIRDYVANHFEEALQSGCITVCYEPVLRALTNKICSFEALARWHDPERGEILPRDFIPVLEETNKIHLLDHFIAKTAIQALHTRQQQDLPIVPVVINLSRRDFCLTDPAGVLNQLTEKYQLPHIYLQVEITETAFVDDEAILTESIQKLRANGYTVTLDNFGEGHSSLAALQRCSIDEISLDKVFFENFTKSSRLLLTSILLMAKTLGIHTAAEGVQTEEQAEFLRRIGCEKIQGPVCRPHATPVDQLQILQQAQALYFESLLEQQVFQQAGLTNLVTDAPIALFVDDEKNFSFSRPTRVTRKSSSSATSTASRRPLGSCGNYRSLLKPDSAPLHMRPSGATGLRVNCSSRTAGISSSTCATSPARTASTSIAQSSTVSLRPRMRTSANSTIRPCAISCSSTTTSTSSTHSRTASKSFQQKSQRERPAHICTASWRPS